MSFYQREERGLTLLMMRRLSSGDGTSSARSERSAARKARSVSTRALSVGIGDKALLKASGLDGV